MSRPNAAAASPQSALMARPAATSAAVPVEPLRGSGRPAATMSAPTAVGGTAPNRAARAQ